MSRIAELNRKAAELTNNINMARRMGETAEANAFRKELTTVRAEISLENSKTQPNPAPTAPAAAAAPPAPPAAPPAQQSAPPAGALVRPAHLQNFIGPVAINQLVPAGSPAAQPTFQLIAPTGPGASTLPTPLSTTPARVTSLPLFQFAGQPPVNGSTVPTGAAAPSAKQTATTIVDETAKGKSIDQIAADRGMTREQIVAQLKAGGLTVSATTPTGANGDVRITTITDPSTGRTVKENYDFQHGSYYMSQTKPGGQTVDTPVRDESGRQISSSVDAKSGDVTTRLVDDFGDGTVTEITSPNGVPVRTTTAPGGQKQTVVSGPDGPVTLAPSQETTAAGVKPITQDITAGKSITQIAADRGLTREQVIAQLQAAGLDVSATKPTGDNGDVQITTITDPSTGRVITENYDFQHGAYYNSVTGGDGPAKTTPIRDESGRKMTTAVDPATGGITTRLENDFGDGTVNESSRLPSGVVMERTTKGSVSNTVVTMPDGTRVGLAPDQVPTRAGVQSIADDIAAGKSIDQIAKQRNLSSAQVMAQLRAAGFDVKTLTPSGNNGDVGGTQLVDEDSGQVIASDTTDYQHGDDISTIVQPGGKSKTVIADGNGGTTETVREPEGRQTRTYTDAKGNKTVAITNNGYTQTTAPDGTKTLHNDKLDVDIPIKKGSKEEALVDVLLNAQPNSSDPAIAKEGKVVTAFIDGLFTGESLPALLARAEAAGAKIPDLKTLGAAINVPLNDDQVADPLSAIPPFGNAPSGKKWVPALVEGQWRWVDPDVAVAIRNEQIALGQLAQAQATVQRGSIQLDVYALDPAYKGAVGDARATINDALEPFNLELNLPRPKGTLEQAQARLATANGLVTEAEAAVDDYKRSLDILEKAIDTNQNMPIYPVRVNPVAAPSDGSFDSAAYAEEQEQLIAKGKQAKADLAELFSQQELFAAQGQHHSLKLFTGSGEFLLSQLDPKSKEYKQLEQDLAPLREARDAAGDQVDLLRAYNNYYGSVADALPVENLANTLLREHVRSKKLVEGQTYRTNGGDALGEYKGSTIDHRGDQIWAIDEFEHGTRETRLTVDPDDKNFNEDYRNRDLNLQWQTLRDNLDNPKICAAAPTEQTQIDRMKAARDLTTLMRDQTTDRRNDLATTLGNLDTSYRDSITQAKGGSVLPPPGTLPEGVQPVAIEVAPGKTVSVAPAVAERYKQLGIAALTGSGTYVYTNVELTRPDGSTYRENRWVPGETGLLQIQRDQTSTAIAGLDKAIGQFEDIRKFQDLQLKEPSKLLAPWNEQQQAFIDNHRGQLLDAVYRPQFQESADGPESKFAPLSGKALDDRVRAALGEGNAGQAGDIVDEIHDIGGATPTVRNVPIFYIDPDGFTQAQTLFAVQGNDGVRYVDLGGKSYDSVQDFRDNTNLYIGGNLVVPKNFEMAKGPDGQIPIEMLDARGLSVLEKVVDPVVGIVTGIATIASFTPLAPIAAPIAFGGAAYLGVRAGYNQVQHMQHGGDWNDRESIMNIAMVSTTVLPFASSGLRTIGLFGKAAELRYGVAGAHGIAQRGMVTAEAFHASIGGAARGSLLAENSMKLMSSTSLMNRTARGFDWTAMGIGVPLMGASGVDLIQHGDQMSGLEFVNAGLGLVVGGFGTAAGARGLMMTRPGRSQSDGPDVAPAVADPQEIIVPGQAKPGDPAVQSSDKNTPPVNGDEAPQVIQKDPNQQQAGENQPSTQMPFKPTKLQDRKVGRSLKAAENAESAAKSLRDQAHELDVKTKQAAARFEELKTELKEVRAIARTERANQNGRLTEETFERLASLPQQVRKAEIAASKADRDAKQDVPKLEARAAALDLKAEGKRQNPVGKNIIGRDKDLLKWISDDVGGPQTVKQYRATEREAARAFEKLKAAGTKLDNAEARQTLAQAEVAKLRQAVTDASTGVARLRAKASLDRAEERLSKLNSRTNDLGRQVQNLQKTFGDQIVGLRDLHGYSPEPAVPAQNGKPALAAKSGMPGFQDKLDVVKTETQRLIDAGEASKQHLDRQKVKLDAADETFSTALDVEQAARDAKADIAEIRRVESLRVRAEQAFRDAQKDYRQAQKDDFTAAKISAEARALKDAVEKIDWKDPQGRNLLPKLNVGKIAVGIVLAHTGAGVYDSAAGSPTAANILASSEANTANYGRSGVSKYAWFAHNHGTTRAFDKAANGNDLAARKALEDVIASAPRHGAQRLGRKQAYDLRADLKQVADAGKKYRDTVESLPRELRDAFPKANFRKDASFDPKTNASHIPASDDINALAGRLAAEDPKYAGQSRDAVVKDLTTKLNEAQASYRELDVTLRNTLNKFPATVRNYRSEVGKLPPEIQKLLPNVEEGISIAGARGLTDPDAVKSPDRAVFEKYAAENNVEVKPLIEQFEKAKEQYAAIDKAANGKIDYKAAEKLPTSSMAPNTPVGLGFKAASFGFNFNGILGWLSKHSPSAGDGFGVANHLGFAGHMTFGSYFQYKYLKALRAVDDFNEARPYANRTDEEHKIFDSLEAERKKWNTRNDLAGFASATRSIIQGVVFWKYGMHEAAAASFYQGVSSLMWVETQQGSISRFFSKVGSLRKKETWSGQGPEVPFTWKSRWNPETGETGQKRHLWGNKWPQPQGKEVGWSNGLKSAARWQSIITGIAVPTLLYLAASGKLDDLLNSDDLFEKKSTLPSNPNPSLVDAGKDMIRDIFARAAEFEAVYSEMVASGEIDAEPSFEWPVGVEADGITMPEPPQGLIVTARSGLNVRTGPSVDSDKKTALSPGAFAMTLAGASPGAGSQWIPIVSASPETGPISGWVSGNYMRPDVDGVGGGAGRVNLELEADSRFARIIAQPLDSIIRIARANNADPVKTVMLNMDHIPDPDKLFPGDRVYLPPATA